MNTLIKIDELRPIVEQLNKDEITYGKAIQLITELTSSRVKKFDSTNLIDGSRERFEELKHKGWDWSSFYNGWLEGRIYIIKDSIY